MQRQAVADPEDLFHGPEQQPIEDEDDEDQEDDSEELHIVSDAEGSGEDDQDLTPGQHTVSKIDFLLDKPKVQTPSKIKAVVKPRPRPTPSSSFAYPA